MNTGIGDAVNLAWKLDAVLRHNAPGAILDTYEQGGLALVAADGFHMRQHHPRNLFQLVLQVAFGRRQRIARLHVQRVQQFLLGQLVQAVEFDAVDAGRLGAEQGGGDQRQAEGFHKYIVTRRRAARGTHTRVLYCLGRW